MQIFFLLLALTAPAFYFVGLITSVTWLYKKLEPFITGTADQSSPDTNTSQSAPAPHLHAPSTSSLDHQFSQTLKTNPHMTLAQFAQSLRPHNTPDHQSEFTPSYTVSPAATHPPEDMSPTPDVQTSPSNWYSQNSISFLLFVGAFLIVAAVSIFTSFQWNIMSNQAKVIIISSFNLAWFAAGSYFFRQPKIRLAGSTFLTLGSLLLPISTYSWHYFVLSPMGTRPGYAALIGSIVWLLINLRLIKLTSHRWFVYLVGLSVTAVNLSLVSILELADPYYILAAMLSAVIILGYKLVRPDTTRATLWKQTAHLIMAGSFVIGLLYTALESQEWLTADVSLGLLVTAIYLLLFQFLNFNRWATFGFITAASTSMVTLLGSYQFSNQLLIYVLAGLAPWWNLIPFAQSRYKAHENIISLTSVVLIIAAYLGSLSLADSSLASLISAVILSLVLLATRSIWMVKAYDWLLVSSWFVALGHLLGFLEIDINYSPLVLSALALGLTLVSLFGHLRSIPTLSPATMAWALITGIWAYGLSLGQSELDLLSAWPLLLAGLVSLSSLGLACHQHRFYQGYYLLGIGFWALSTWTLTLSGVSLTQLYTLPLGIWLLLGNLKWPEDDESKNQLVEGAGLGVILLPTLFQSEQILYAVLLGLYGLILILLGTHLGKTGYRASGFLALALAVIIQTVDYVLLLPTWLLVGVVGLAILALAVYLLNKRDPKITN